MVAAADTGEAGVRIEGIAFVLDAMFGSQPVMDPFTGLEVPETVPISQQVSIAAGAGSSPLRLARHSGQQEGLRREPFREPGA